MGALGFLLAPRARDVNVSRAGDTVRPFHHLLQSKPMSSDQSFADGEFRNPELYVNRELAWLAFNERVLDQAKDASWPLLERLKFLAIFGSNLDEFFMIRVSGLHELLDAKAPSTAADGHSAVEQMAQIRALVSRLTESAALLWIHDLLPELARQQIKVRSFADLGLEQREWARAYFRRA